jgi:hypothetical protein
MKRGASERSMTGNQVLPNKRYVRHAMAVARREFIPQGEKKAPGAMARASVKSSGGLLSWLGVARLEARWKLGERSNPE